MSVLSQFYTSALTLMSRMLLYILYFAAHLRLLPPEQGSTHATLARLTQTGGRAFKEVRASPASMNCPAPIMIALLSAKLVYGRVQT